MKVMKCRAVWRELEDGMTTPDLRCTSSYVICRVPLEIAELVTSSELRAAQVHSLTSFTRQRHAYQFQASGGSFLLQLRSIQGEVSQVTQTPEWYSIYL